MRSAPFGAASDRRPSASSPSPPPPPPEASTATAATAIAATIAITSWPRFIPGSPYFEPHRYRGEPGGRAHQHLALARGALAGHHRRRRAARGRGAGIRARSRRRLRLWHLGRLPAAPRVAFEQARSRA